MRSDRKGSIGRTAGKLGKMDGTPASIARRAGDAVGARLAGVQCCPPRVGEDGSIRVSPRVHNPGHCCLVNTRLLVNPRPRRVWTSAGSVRPGRPQRVCGILGVSIGVALAGCSSSRVTDPERTATEQFLLSTAATEAVRQLSFDVLRGRRVFVDTEYFAASDQAFVLGEVRARLLQSGVQIAEAPESAQVILEVRSGGVGIDRNDYLLGIPSLQLMAGGPVGPGLATPDLAVVQNRYQLGAASVSYVAYWRETGDVVAMSGPFIGRSFRDDWWFVGIGPRSRGDIPPVLDDPVEAVEAGARPGAAGTVPPVAPPDAAGPSTPGAEG